MTSSTSSTSAKSTTRSFTTSSPIDIFKKKLLLFAKICFGFFYNMSSENKQIQLNIKIKQPFYVVVMDEK